MKKPMKYLAAVALLLALSGCAPTAPEGLTGDRATVADLALSTDKQTREERSETATVIDVYEWKDGYSVLIRTDGKNPAGDYSNYHAYGYERDGKTWTLEADSGVYDDFDPAHKPAIATCMALADGYEERAACSATK